MDVAPVIDKRKLHFTGFETGFDEIAPRLVEAGHDIVIYCRRGSYPEAMRVPTYRGVRLVYMPSPGGKNFSGLIATFFAVLHALATGRYDIFFFDNVGIGQHASLCRGFGKKVVMIVDGLDWKQAKWGPLARGYFFFAARSAVRFCTALVIDAEAMRVFWSFSPVRLEEEARRGRRRQLRQSLPSRAALTSGREDHPHRPHRRPGGHSRTAPQLLRLRARALRRRDEPSLLKAMGYGNCVLALDTVFNREVLAEGGILIFARRGRAGRRDASAGGESRDGGGAPQDGGT